MKKDHENCNSKRRNELRIPLTISGGIRNIENFREILKSVADKIFINSSAIKNLTLVESTSKEFGPQCVVVAIASKRDEKENFKVYINGRRKNTELNLIYWAKKCEQLGAGEILLISMNANRTKKGYDIEMTKLIIDNFNIPVIASGGCGDIRDIVNVF